MALDQTRGFQPLIRGLCEEFASLESRERKLASENRSLRAQVASLREAAAVVSVVASEPGSVACPEDVGLPRALLRSGGGASATFSQIGLLGNGGRCRSAEELSDTASDHCPPVPNERESKAAEHVLSFDDNHLGSDGEASRSANSSMFLRMMNGSKLHAAASMCDDMAYLKEESNVNTNVSPKSNGNSMLPSISMRSGPPKDDHITLPNNWPATLKRREVREGTVSNQVKSLKRGLTRISNISEDFTFTQMKTDIIMISRESATPRKHCVLHPSSKLRLIFDALSMLALVHDLTMTPFVLAWNVSMEGWVQASALTALVYWSFDIFISFRTGYYVHGELQMDSKVIAWHYAQTTLLPDLIIVGCEWVGTLLNQVQNGSTSDTFGAVRLVRFMKAFRVLRVVAVLRTHRMSEVILKLKEISHMNLGLSTFMEVLALLILIMWLNHVISCLWYSIGKYSTADTDTTWLDLPAYHMEGGPSYGESGRQYQYFTSLHWSMTQMTPGSMQVNPQNSAERAFNVVCLTFGLLFFSSVVSSISGRLMQYTMKKTGQTAKLAELDRFMRQANVSTALRISIQKQAATRMAIQKPLVINQIEALTLVSLSMKADLQMELGMRHLQSHQLFNVMLHMDLSFARDICNHAINFSVLSPSDTLFFAGTDAAEAYCFYRGGLKYMQDPMTSRIEEPVTHDLAPTSWICEMALWCYWVHVGEAEALEMTELMNIQADELRIVLRRHDTVHQVTCEYADLYFECLLSAHPPREPWPSDIHVPHTSWDEMVHSMPCTARMAVGLLAIDLIKAHQSKGFTSALGKLKAPDLESEVREGASALYTEGGCPTRVIIGTSMKLHGEANTILVQLAKFTEELKLQIHVRLPGIRRHLGESTRAGVKRLLNGKLQPFVTGVSFGEVQRSEKVERTIDGMRTKQISEVHTASLKPGFTPSQTGPHPLVPCPDNNSPYEIYCFSFGNTVRIYAWLPEMEYQRLHGERGASEIREWLNAADFHVEDFESETAREDLSMASSLSVTPRRVMSHEETLWAR